MQLLTINKIGPFKTLENSLYYLSNLAPQLTLYEINDGRAPDNNTAPFFSITFYSFPHLYL